MGALELDAKPYTFRPYTPEDIPFIQSSWGKSYYLEGPGNTLFKADVFHKYHRPLREWVLNKPNATAIVCSSKDDPSFILGFSILEKPEEPVLILHYIYVKFSFRGEGIGRELFNRSIVMRPVLFTHETSKAQKIMSKNKRLEKNDFERFIHCPHIFKGAS